MSKIQIATATGAGTVTAGSNVACSNVAVGFAGSTTATFRLSTINELRLDSTGKVPGVLVDAAAVTFEGTVASVVYTFADATPIANSQKLSLTMYGDAAAEVHDITFDTSVAINDSDTTITDDLDNTYSATVGLAATPSDVDLARTIATLLNSHAHYNAVVGGTSGASTVTITAKVKETTTYNIADNSSNTTNGAVGAPVTGFNETNATVALSGAFHGSTNLVLYEDVTTAAGQVILKDYDGNSGSQAEHSRNYILGLA
jgi:hypothetical protein